MAVGFGAFRRGQIGVGVGLAAGSDEGVAAVVGLAAGLAPDLAQGLVRLGALGPLGRPALPAALLVPDLRGLAVLQRMPALPGLEIPIRRGEAVLARIELWISHGVLPMRRAARRDREEKPRGAREVAAKLRTKAGRRVPLSERSLRALRTGRSRYSAPQRRG